MIVELSNSLVDTEYGGADERIAFRFMDASTVLWSLQQLRREHHFFEAAL